MRQTVNAGGGPAGVATNEGSYGTTPASDQFIGMTRMRSAETGLDLVHAAVTDEGELGRITGLATMEILYGEARAARPGLRTVYVRLGEWVAALAVVIGAVAVWISARRSGESPIVQQTASSGRPVGD